MDKRTTGIIVTVISVLLCGCPGLAGLCFGSVMILAGLVPGAQIDIFGSSDMQTALMTGLIILLVSVFFLGIPVLVGYLTLRRNPGENLDEGIPPPL